MEMFYIFGGFLGDPGPIKEKAFQWIREGKLGVLGPSFPSGSLYFLPSENIGAPSDPNTQYHLELVARIDPRELWHRFLQQGMVPPINNSSPLYPYNELERCGYGYDFSYFSDRCGFWRVTRCQDHYPALIIMGRMIYAPTTPLPTYAPLIVVPEAYKKHQKLYLRN